MENGNSSNQTNLKRCSASGKSKYFGGLHKLAIREHSSDKLCLTWFYITHNIIIQNLDEVLAWEWIKWLLHWHSLFFGFEVLLFSFISILMKELKYFPNFWLTLFWVCSLEFLLIIIFSANWGSVLN